MSNYYADEIYPATSSFKLYPPHPVLTFVATATLKRFWILWSPQSSMPPRVKFDNKEEALRVAKLMAEKHSPQEFYVCESVGKYQIDKPTARYTQAD